MCLSLHVSACARSLHVCMRMRMSWCVIQLLDHSISHAIRDLATGVPFLSFSFQGRYMLALTTVCVVLTSPPLTCYHHTQVLDPSTNTIRTLSGSGKPGYKDGTGTEVQFSEPGGLALGPGDSVFVADTNNSLIRCVSVC